MELTLSDVYGVLEKVREKLGDDLVYAIALDEGEYYLSVSTHKSKTQKFDHDGFQRTCKFDKSEKDKSIDFCIDNAVEEFSRVLLEKEPVEDLEKEIKKHIKKSKKKNK